MSLKSITSPDSIAPTSPFSNFSNLSNSSISAHSTTTTSPTLITSATYKKPTTKHVTQLSTSSPAGIAVANQATPQRLAQLLLITGPLAIRHITSNLSKQINGFDKLSLSKQRRLIMGCLNQGYQEGSIIFEKIGWGQWSAKRVSSENFIKERNAIRISNAKVKDDENQNSTSNFLRRESITKNKYEVDQHDKLLKKNIINNNGNNNNNNRISNDFAIVSDDDDDNEDEELQEEAVISSTSDFDEDDEDSNDNVFHEDDEHVFKLDDESQIPPLKLNSRVIISPPSTSTSTTRRSSFNRPANGITKPKSLKHRSNSQTPTSPELLYYSTQIETSSQVKTINSRRHSSIRSTLSNETEINHIVNSDTDEEDWRSIGAIKLMKSINKPQFESSSLRTQQGPFDPLYQIKSSNNDEEDAAFALVNLRSL